MLSRLSKYSYAVCQHKVLVPMCNLMTRRRPDKASAHIEITKLSSQSNLSYFNQQTRSFSEHFTPYDGKEKCPTKEIFMLVQHGSVEDLREWIETGGIDVNCRDENMKTPLIVAAELNRSEMMKVLMEHGADVNLQDIFGDTALIAASRENNKKAVELLLQHKATQLDVKDHEEMAAADYTEDMEIDECIRRKADTNFVKRKEEGLCPLQVQPKEESESSRSPPPSDKKIG